MAESRDRRVTPPLDITAMFAQRRASPFFILPDSDPFTFGASPSAAIRPPRTFTARGRALALRPPGAQNTPLAVTRRGRARTPLRDITALVRAREERRGVPVGDTDEVERTPLPVRESSAAGSRLEDQIVASPVSVKIRTSSKDKIKIVLEIPKDEDSEFMTPQKKLLESIDLVDKAVREEIQRMKRTPSGRRMEREKRVKTLMSMR